MKYFQVPEDGRLETLKGRKNGEKVSIEKFCLETKEAWTNFF